MIAYQTPDELISRRTDFSPPSTYPTPVKPQRETIRNDPFPPSLIGSVQRSKASV